MKGVDEERRHLQRGVAFFFLIREKLGGFRGMRGWHRAQQIPLAKLASPRQAGAEEHQPWLPDVLLGD